jgi:ABC-2 type transport system ATP-binding protein
MQSAIETSELTRRFGATVAVHNLQLTVPYRQVTGFLGPNGAGKTTTIRMLLGLLQPTSGSIRVFGRDLRKDRRTIAASVGALVETPCHYDHLTGAENLQISCRLLGARRAELDRALSLVGLAHARGQRVGGYSLGMRQRLGIARALLGRPRLLILDEPTNGLDPEGIIDMRNLLRALAAEEGLTLLVSSHLLAEVERSVDHVILLEGGRLLAQAPLDELIAGTVGRLQIGVRDPVAASAVLAQHGFSAVRGNNGVLEIVRSGAAVASEINALLVRNGIAVFRLSEDRPSLEAAYLQLTGQAHAQREAA